MAAAVLAAVLGVPVLAVAEPAPEPPQVTLMTAAGGPIASTAARLVAVDSPAVQPGRSSATPSRRGRAARKAIGAVAGGVGGFFAGGFIGAKLEPDCRCDDPGLKGFLFGAPIGAALGAVLGSMVD